MKKALQMVTVLGIIGLVAGTSLVLVYRYAAPLIEANQKRELREAIFKVVPGAAGYETVTKDGEEFFKVYGGKEELLGYAFIAEGNGYQGKIKMLAAAKKDLSGLYGIEILESVETPGLGGEIASVEFKEQFRGLVCLPAIECVKGRKDKAGEIQAITGATISSQSVTTILNERISGLSEVLGR